MTYDGYFFNAKVKNRTLVVFSLAFFIFLSLVLTTHWGNMKGRSREYFTLVINGGMNEAENVTALDQVIVKLLLSNRSAQGLSYRSSGKEQVFQTLTVNSTFFLTVCSAKFSTPVRRWRKSCHLFLMRCFGELWYQPTNGNLFID